MTTTAIVDSLALDPGAGSPTRERSGRLTSLVQLVGPTTLLTGLLYYYGYVNLRAYYAYFGINLGVLDLSPADYVRRTPDTLFKPIGYVTTILVALFVAHLVVSRWLSGTRPHVVRRVVAVTAAAAVLIGGSGLVAFYTATGGALPPLALVIGSALLEYSLWLFDAQGRPGRGVRDALRQTADLRRGLVIALVVIGTFWAVAGIARERGEALARETETSLLLQPRAVVYSSEDLHLPPPGVTTVPLTGEGSAYAFRSNGLRPLVFANHRWFLLPALWTHDNDATVIVLRDDMPGVRVDLAPGDLSDG